MSTFWSVARLSFRVIDFLRSAMTQKSLFTKKNFFKASEGYTLIEKVTQNFDLNISMCLKGIIGLKKIKKFKIIKKSFFRRFLCINKVMFNMLCSKCVSFIINYLLSIYEWYMFVFLHYIHIYSYIFIKINFGILLKT